jgi:opacity protein-like surface antigen
MRGITMNDKLAGLLGLALALLSSGTATANGYRERNVPAPIPVSAPMPIPESFTYYLRGDIGWGFAGDPSFSESGAIYGAVAGLSYGALSNRGSSADDVFFGGVGAGVYLSPHLRADITLDLRGSQDVVATATYTDVGPGTVRETIKLRGTVGLINAYWDLLPRGSFSPYIGAGVGFVYNDIDRTHLTTESGVTANSGSSGDTNVGLAAALMAGVTIARHHGWALDINYRALYMDGGSVTTTLTPLGGASTADIGHQWEHQVRVGLRANLW